MSVRDLLSVQEVPATAEHGTYRMDPAVPMAWTIGQDKSPLKVLGRTEITVPIHSWKSAEEETAAVIKVMARAATGVPIGVHSVESLTRAFWTKLRFNERACIFNPALLGRFVLPQGALGIPSLEVEPDWILCLGREGRVGTLMVQRGRSGYVLPIHRGVVGVRLYKGVVGC